MLVQGNYYKIGNQWLAEIPLLQSIISAPPGGDKAVLMDSVREMARQFKIDINLVNSSDVGKFFFRVENIDQFLPIILKRARLAKKLSIGDVVKRLGYSSRNSYAQYEYGKTRLTFVKYGELMNAIVPERETVLTTIH